jgi:hypothetical protein
MIKNVFNDITPQEKLPPQLKKDMLKNMDAAKLLLDIWDLFAPKRIAMNINILTLNNQNNSNPISKK